MRQQHQEVVASSLCAAHNLPTRAIFGIWNEKKCKYLPSANDRRRPMAKKHVNINKVFGEKNANATANGRANLRRETHFFYTII